SDPECFNYTTSNSNKSISFCNVPEMDRCVKSISYIPQFAPIAFLTLNGTSLTQFAWLCPTEEFCCDWSCCKDTQDMAPMIVGVMFASFSLMTMVVYTWICIRFRQLRRQSTRVVYSANPRQ
ncbi:hypothetical protein PFISCL1PPCAC_2490, partial [Pristionchus fissidentatus]